MACSSSARSSENTGADGASGDAGALMESANGSGVTSESSSGGNAGEGEDPALPAGGAGDVVMGPGCPEAEPAEGDACDVANLLCSYGDSVRRDCRVEYKCLDSWNLTDGDCAETPPNYCPPQPMPGEACQPQPYQLEDGVSGVYAACPYDTATLCYCEFCRGPACGDGPPGGTWTCPPPPPAEECPAVAPNIGAPCDAQGVNCIYGDACTPSGHEVFCRLGVWQTGFGPGCRQ